MASASVHLNTDFIDQISQTRKAIHDSFKRSHEALRIRENSLLSRVEEIEKDFNTKTQEITKLLETLNSTKSYTSENLISNELKDVQDIFHQAIDTKVEKLLARMDHKIEFEWNPEFEASIERLGSIKLNSLPNTSLTHSFLPRVKPVVPDYKTKQLPLAYSCKGSTNKKDPGDFNSPRGLAIHYQTGNIYIADIDNNRIQVFNHEGGFLFMFSERVENPTGICISLNKVFVTQYGSSCINVYELGGKLLRSVGSIGNGEGQFNNPYGLDISEGNTIYVCDNSNDRIQILTEDFKFHSMLGIGVLNRPRDVKVTRDRVLVLDRSDLCLSVFNPDHVLTNRIITRGFDGQVLSSFSFDVDRENNIIMSDYANCVTVFNQDGVLIHKFGKRGQDVGDFSRPYGIALDNKGRIIVVDHKSTACLQIF